VSGAGNQTQYKWTLGVRLLTHQIPRAAVRTTLTYQVHPRLQLGVEYNPRAGEFKPLANFFLVTETEKRPALMIGTSTDRIGTPRGQAFFSTVSKNLKQATGLPIAPYVGAAYGTFDHRLRPIAGLTVFLGKGFSLINTFNGVQVHPVLNFTHGRHALSLVMVKGRQPGMSYSVRF
jgi:hypothetical protein